jgi:hypothetical protein
VHDPLFDPIGEAPRVETVLEAAVAFVVDAHVEIMRLAVHEIHVAAS